MTMRRSRGRAAYAHSLLCRSAIVPVGSFIAMTGCMMDAAPRANPTSEIALAVQQEYRRFVENAEDDLGARFATDDGRVLPAPTRRDPDAPPKKPPMVEAIPRTKSPGGAYWEKRMLEPQSAGSRVVALQIDDLLDRTLARSNQIAAFSDAPLIRQTVVREAQGKYDTVLFASADAQTTDNIRSSTLETGTSANAPDTLSEDRFGVEVGLRQPLITGGELKLSQRVGGRDSNSEFFVPNDQAEAELKLELRQPLLDGAGITVNSAPIQLAELERDRSIAEFKRQVETQLTEVLRAYWTLYAERSKVMQREHLVRDLSGLAGRISSRARYDALPGEAAQARAALRRAEACRNGTAAVRTAATPAAARSPRRPSLRWP